MSILQIPSDITQIICDQLSIKRLIQLRSTGRLLRDDCEDIYQRKLTDFQTRLQRALRMFENMAIPYMENAGVFVSPPYTIIMRHEENVTDDEFVSRNFTLYHNDVVIYESPEYPIYERKFPALWNKSYSKSSWESFADEVQHVLVQYEMDDFKYN